MTGTPQGHETGPWHAPDQNAELSAEMFTLRNQLILSGLMLLASLGMPSLTAAHAALERSEPAAGATLESPPDEIRIWFTEPLEQAYTGADLLTATGEAVPDVVATISPDNPRLLVVGLPADVAPGAYTVAWRTLSSADGHTLDGYFGFQVGAGVTPGVTPDAASTGQADTARQISRGLALVGLAALLAIAPMTLGIFDPLAAANARLGTAIRRALRRYTVLAAALALLGSGAALVAQAMAIAPHADIVAALLQTLGDTRYGQLWLLRFALLLVLIIILAGALGDSRHLNRRMLWLATIVGFVVPIPFSLLSHAAAQVDGQLTAIAIDVLHLLTAALWGGGLFMLAVVLLPALRTATPDQRRAALGQAIPRFSVLGVAAWVILLLSGIYASWLQVGTFEALRTTSYGQTLLLKGALLLPILALAAYHLRRGWGGLAGNEGRRLAATLALEALIVVAVLLAVGRLIGLEPAREVAASRTPGVLTLPVSFDVSEGARDGHLTISPGVAGNNSFTLQVEGEPVEAGSAAVLRFLLPGAGIGEQELALPEVATNQFSATGSELGLAGQWEVTAIVRKIGSYSWQSLITVPIGTTPPAAPVVNPPPLFTTQGVLGVVVLAIGITGIVAATLLRTAEAVERVALAVVGIVGVIGGGMVLNASRLPEAAALPVSGVASTPAAASPTVPPATPVASHHHHVARATPVATESAAQPGTPVAAGNLHVSIDAEPRQAGPVSVTVRINDDVGDPLTDARVTIMSEMAGMAEDRAQTAAEEVQPGRYLAEDVPLTMPGEWRLAVRVSPRGEATQIVPFVVEVP